MTGTPVQNSPKELFSYLHFLEYDPFCNMAALPALYAGKDMHTIVRRLREIVRPIMLRRTKASCIDGQPIMPLPERCGPFPLPRYLVHDRSEASSTFDLNSYSKFSLRFVSISMDIQAVLNQM